MAKFARVSVFFLTIFVTVFPAYTKENTPPDDKARIWEVGSSIKEMDSVKQKFKVQYRDVSPSEHVFIIHVTTPGYPYWVDTLYKVHAKLESGHTYCWQYDLIF